LAVAFNNNTAKLLQMIRITNVDGRYSQAPIAQMQCCRQPLAFSAYGSLNEKIEECCIIEMMIFQIGLFLESALPDDVT
jgi:hypothetical protein